MSISVGSDRPDAFVRQRARWSTCLHARRRLSARPASGHVGNDIAKGIASSRPRSAVVKQYLASRPGHSTNALGRCLFPSKTRLRTDAFLFLAGTDRIFLSGRAFFRRACCGFFPAPGQDFLSRVLTFVFAALNWGQSFTRQEEALLRTRMARYSAQRVLQAVHCCLDLSFPSWEVPAMFRCFALVLRAFLVSCFQLWGRLRPLSPIT